MKLIGNKDHYQNAGLRQQYRKGILSYTAYYLAVISRLRIEINN